MFGMDGFVVLRNGSYDRSTHELNATCREKLSALSNYLKGVLPENGIRILSSGEPSSQKSAEIVAKKLGVERIVTEEYLWNSSGSPTLDSYENNKNPQRLVQILQENQSYQKGLIVVADKGVSEDLVRIYALLSNMDPDTVYSNLGSSEGIYFDNLKRKTKKLSTN